LNFVRDEKTKIFKAYSDSVLRIENKSLGYMLSIILDSLVYIPNEYIRFRFYTSFKELTAVTEEEKQTWENNRQKTYLDSPKHFFYSLVHNRLNDDYYILFRLLDSSTKDSKIEKRILPKDIDLTCVSDSTIYKLHFNGLLEIRRRNLNPPGELFFYHSLSIDEYGNLLTPFPNVKISGIWAKQGIADTLPLDYIYDGN
jgi:hypothetical protein